jgi:hypothetical protein
MTAISGKTHYQFLADFLSQFLKLVQGKFLDLSGTIHFLKILAHSSFSF